MSDVPGDVAHYFEVTVDIRDKATGDTLRVTMHHVAAWQARTEGDPLWPPLSVQLADGGRLEVANLVLAFDVRRQPDKEFLYELRSIPCTA